MDRVLRLSDPARSIGSFANLEPISKLRSLSMPSKAARYPNPSPVAFRPFCSEPLAEVCVSISKIIYLYIYSRMVYSLVRIPWRALYPQIAGCPCYAKSLSGCCPLFCRVERCFTIKTTFEAYRLAQRRADRSEYSTEAEKDIEYQ